MKLFLVITLLLAWVNAFALVNTDKQELAVQNLYTNGGFENGTKDVIVSSAVKTWESSTKYLGGRSLKCAFDATNDYCELKLVTNPGDAANMEYGFFYKTTVATIKADVIDGSGNVVRTINPLPSNTAFQEKIAEFVAGASTAYKIRFTATSGAGDIYIDQVRMSRYLGVGSVDLKDKEYTLTVTGDNSWSTTYAKGRPLKDRDNNWKIKLTIIGTTSSTANETITISGVNFSPTNQTCTVSQQDGSGSNYIGYASVQSTNTISWQCATTRTTWAVNCEVSLSGIPSFATDYVSEQVTRAENANQFGAVKWAESASRASSTSTSYVTLNDASFASGQTYIGSASTPTNSGDLGFKVSSLQPGTYQVKFQGDFFAGFASPYTECIFAIYDGTNRAGYSFLYTENAENPYAHGSTLVGTFTYASTQTNLNFTVQAKRGPYGTCYGGSNSSSQGFEMSIEPVYPTANMPQIINSVGTTYQGQSLIRFGNISSSGTISQTGSGDWASTRVTTGQYYIDFSSPFASTNYSCSFTVYDNNDAYVNLDFIGTRTSSRIYYGVYLTTTSGFIDRGVNFICIGIK